MNQTTDILRQLCLTLMLLACAITPLQAEEAESVYWIDVRTEGEFEQGHVEGAVRIPFDGIEKGVAELGLEKDAKIYLYCGAGGRAERARTSLVAQGYTAVTNAGGLDDARKLKADQP